MKNGTVAGPLLSVLMACIEVDNWPNQASHVGIAFYLILTKLTSYTFIRW